jgi:O-antigen ligase
MQKHMINRNIVSSDQDLVFVIFCLWTIVLLCRPQDIFPVLSPLRPALVMGILTLGAVLMHARAISGPPFPRERQVQYYAVLLIIMVFGIPFSLYSRLSFMIIFTEYINVIFFFFIFYRLIDSEKKLSTLLFLCCLGNGLYSAFSVITGNFADGRLSFGGMFDPNDLAFFASAFLPLNLLFISRDNSIWVRSACLACFGFGVLLIFLTGSRGGLLALGVAGILLLLGKSRTINSPMKVCVVAMTLAIISFSPINADRFLTLFSISEDYNVQEESGRLAIWGIGVRAMLANPVTGVGVGCFSNAVGQDRVDRWADILAWQTAHNSAIQIGTETGLIGLLMFLLISLNVVRIFYRAKKIAVSDGLVRIGEMGFVGFVGMFVSAMFLSQAYSLYWAFYVVFSAVVNQFLEREQSLAAENS